MSKIYAGLTEDEFIQLTVDLETLLNASQAITGLRDMAEVLSVCEGYSTDRFLKERGGNVELKDNLDAALAVCATAVGMSRDSMREVVLRAEKRIADAGA